jgi:uncharacterized protein YkwD
VVRIVQHYDLVMRVLSLAVFVSLGFATVALAQPTDAEGEAEMLTRINEMRQAAGMNPLVRNPNLDAAARTHSADMAWHRDFNHVSARTGDPSARVAATGMTAAAVGENIARNATTLDALQALIASDPHRENLLNPQYTHIGLAAVQVEGEVWVTQVFARLPEAATAPVAPQAPANPIPPVLPAPVVPAPAPQSVAPAQPAPQVQQAPQDGASVTGALPSPQVQQVQTNAQGQPQGYWVFSQGRWWYYPIPAGAQPGQVLQPDPNVQGPPPGYNGTQPGAQRGYYPPPGPVRSYGYGTQYNVYRGPAPSAPPFGWSPRRRYH